LKKIGLVVKKDIKAQKKADDFEKWLRAKGVDVLRSKDFAFNKKLLKGRQEFAPPDLECIFVLGGDGTFLSAVRWIGSQGIPILGIKFGTVGFLAGITEDALFNTAEMILNEQYITESRIRLLVKVIRNKKEVKCETILNDVVINKRALARLTDIKTYINDHYLTTYRADGLIVSTPTGSTAYSLAAGGPIIHPSVPSIIMTPICPFTLTNRPLIISDKVCIKILLENNSSELMLTFDGQEGFEINDHDIIIISKSTHPVRMITISDQHYFDVLKTKLNWSGSHL